MTYKAPKTSPPNTITPGIRISMYEYWGDTNIQTKGNTYSMSSNSLQFKKERNKRYNCSAAGKCYDGCKQSAKGSWGDTHGPGPKKQRGVSMVW